MKEEDIRGILTHFNGIVVVDEAYIDFSADRSIVSWINDFPNLVILQTFSKAWGMASLRLGMGFANETVVNILNKIKMPYNVNGITQELAYKALINVAEKDRMVSEILEQKEWLKSELCSIGFGQENFPFRCQFLSGSI